VEAINECQTRHHAAGTAKKNLEQYTVITIATPNLLYIKEQRKAIHDINNIIITIVTQHSFGILVRE
jgi:hypothetical protein